MSAPPGEAGAGEAISDLDALVAAHMAQVRRLSQPGGPLSVGAPTATVLNPAWFRGGALSPARRRLHDRLIAKANEGAGTDQRRHAIVMAGPPGAGKSSARGPYMERAGLDPSTFTVVDADHFKDGLVQAALSDGSYEGWIKPAEVRRLEEQGERFFPLEMSALLQRESGLLADAQREDLVAAGANVVIDTVLGDADKAVMLGRQFEAAGYTVTVLDVEVSAELSRARIERRWESAYRQALDGGGDGGGGRWVPSEYARMVFDGPEGPGGPSRSEAAAARLARSCPVVLRYQVLRTEGGPDLALQEQPQLVVDLARSASGQALLPVPRAGRGDQVPPGPEDGHGPTGTPGGPGQPVPPLDVAALPLAERAALRAQSREAARRSAPQAAERPPLSHGPGPVPEVRPRGSGPSR